MEESVIGKHTLIAKQINEVIKRTRVRQHFHKREVMRLYEGLMAQGFVAQATVFREKLLLAVDFDSEKNVNLERALTILGEIADSFAIPGAKYENATVCEQ